MTDRQRILSLIDSAVQCRCHATLFSDPDGEPVAEGALRAWAETHGHAIETYALAGHIWNRTIEVNIRPSTRIVVFCS